MLQWPFQRGWPLIRAASLKCSTLFIIHCTVEPLLRGHPDERPPPLERPLDFVNLNKNVLISTPDERPPLLKGHFSGAKGGGLTGGVPLYIEIQ